MWSTAHDPVARLGLSMAILLTAAKLGGDLASRARQAAVLGELLSGLVLGVVPLPFFQAIRQDPYIDVLARLGVLILLFEVGLETTFREVMKVGWASARVAALGTAGSFGAGWLAAATTMPQSGRMAHLFVAAALGATSIGISVRVLKDLEASRTVEAHTILGAAVIDDVIGLVALAVFAGAVGSPADGHGFGPVEVLWVMLKTLGFLATALVVGVKASPVLFGLSSRLRTSGVLVATGLSLCFALAWAADAIGLAGIVGAFTAGLVLEESHSAGFVRRGEPSLHVRLEPISSWLVPIFFVLTGMRADLRALLHPVTLLLVAALLAAAVVGKLLCGLGVSHGTDRFAVAAGMLPRGEVSLIFASLGLAGHLFDSALYSALVTVVVLTTLATPAALRWRMRAHRPSPL